LKIIERYIARELLVPFTVVVTILAVLYSSFISASLLSGAVTESLGIAATLKLILLKTTIALDVLIPRLGQKRPVFHSEADFQHALAWEAHQIDPELQIRLETHPEPNVRLDLLLTHPDLRAYTVVEPKYLTALWSGLVKGEQFALKNQGAQDVRAYDIVKDIGRLERFVAGKPGTIDLQRPLCAYPLVSRYKGAGATADATSFVCAARTPKRG